MGVPRCCTAARTRALRALAPAPDHPKRGPRGPYDGRLSRTDLREPEGETPSGYPPNTHYSRNLLAKVPKSAQLWVATMVRTIFDQPDAKAVRDQFGRLVEAIEARLPDVATHRGDARDDLLALHRLPTRDLVDGPLLGGCSPGCTSPVS